jgi:hypothetical protein
VPNTVLNLIERTEKDEYQRETEQYHRQFERTEKLEEGLHRLVMRVL